MGLLHRPDLGPLLCENDDRSAEYVGQNEYMEAAKRRCVAPGPLYEHLPLLVAALGRSGLPLLKLIARELHLFGHLLVLDLLDPHPSTTRESG